MHRRSHYLLNSRMQMAQLGYAQVKSLSTQLTHADGPVGIYTSEVIIYSTHACRWHSWDILKWSQFILNSCMQMTQLGYKQVKSIYTQLTHADGPVGICTGEVIIYSIHACRWPSWDMHRRSHYLLSSRMQIAQLGYAQVKTSSTQLTHADDPVGIYSSEVNLYSTHACRWPSWDILKWSQYILNSRMQTAQLGYAQEKSLSTQLTHADGPVGICTSEVIIYSTHACRWPSWDIHKWSHYLLNSRMQMAQLGYTQVKSIYTQLTHADGPVGIYTSEVIIYSTHACRWPSWDIYKWSQYILNSRMQTAQVGYAQEKSLSTQLTHADGPVGIRTSENIIYSTHACRWPSWDILKWSQFILNSRMQMTQLGYKQVKSIYTQLTHADGPVGICTGEAIIYSTHACRWPSWDIHEWNQNILNSRMQMAQLGYTQVKSLSTQLTHADGPVGICTGEVIIYSTHACRWPSWDMHKWSQYLLNSRMQMAQLGYAQVKSLSTQLTHADGTVEIYASEVNIYSTHACRRPSWDMHRRSHYLLNSRMQMAQLGYAQVKTLSTQLTHADGPVGIYSSEANLYSTHACRWPSWDINKWSQYILNSRMQTAQLGYAQEKPVSTQLTHADGPVGIYTSEIKIYSTHACRWPSWDIHKWSHYLLNSRMQMAQLGYAQKKSLSTQLTHADGPVGICTSGQYLLNSRMQMAQLGYAQVKSLSTQLTHADGTVEIYASEVNIYSTHACRRPSWDMHRRSHYLLNSRMQMAQLGYAQVKTLSTQLTHADGPVGIYSSEANLYSTHACRWPSWDINKWSQYILNSRMQTAQLGYAQEKPLSTQLTHADGPVGIYTSEINIYSTHACRWPSWDMHKWSHYLLNSRMQMAQLKYTPVKSKYTQLTYAQEKSLSTQLTHADGPVGICTGEVIIYSTHAYRWPSWDILKWSQFILNSRMRMTQLGYAQVKSLSTQLTHADGTVEIYASEVKIYSTHVCTGEVIIYSTHACRWPSWDMHRRSHYLLNSRMQMAQLKYTPVKSKYTQLTYAQEKSLSTQLTHADGPVGIYTSEVIIYSTHACRWPSWDMHRRSHYLLNSRMQMAQLGYAQVKSISTQLTHADGPVGICTSEVIIYSTHACRWHSWNIRQWSQNILNSRMHRRSHYLLNSRMQMAQLGYAQEKSLSTQLTHADGPVGIYSSEVNLYSAHACGWPSWDINKWSQYILNSRMQTA